MSTGLTNLKNIIWAMGIVLCLFAVVVGLLVTGVIRNGGDIERSDLVLSEAPRKDKPAAELTLSDGVEAASGAVSSPEATASAQTEGAEKTPSKFSLWLNGLFKPTIDSASQEMEAGVGLTSTLMVLSESEDAGSEYIDDLTFICDSAFAALKSYDLVKGSQVWLSASADGTLPLISANEMQIIDPSSASAMTPAAAAAAAKPAILVLCLGNDGLEGITESTFQEQYIALIKDIKAQSPDTKVICCSMCSVSTDYTGIDIGAADINAYNSMIKKVCIETGSYYANIGTVINDLAGNLVYYYAGDDARSLNSTGGAKLLEYLRTHALT